MSERPNPIVPSLLVWASVGGLLGVLAGQVLNDRAGSDSPRQSRETGTASAEGGLDNLRTACELLAGDLNAVERNRLRSVVREAFERDPGGVLLELRNHGMSGLIDPPAVAAHFSAAARRDLLASLNAARQIEDRYLRETALRQCFDIAVKTDPEIAFDLLDLFHADARSDLAVAWAERDPKAAFEAFFAEQRFHRTAALVLGLWSFKEPQASLEYLMQHSERIGELMVRDALAGMAETAVMAPALWKRILESLKPGWRSPYLEKTIYKAVMKDDPEFVVNDLLRNRHSLETLRTGVTILGMAAWDQPELTGQLQKAVPSERARTDAYKAAASAHYSDGIAAVAEWFDRIDDPVAVAPAKQYATTDLVLDKPAESVLYALERLGAGDDAWMELVLNGLKLRYSDDDFFNLELSEKTAWMESLTAVQRRALLEAVQKRSNPAFSLLESQLSAR